MRFKKNVVFLSCLRAADTGGDKCECCKMRVAQYPSMRLHSGASDVLCSGKARASGRRVPRKLTVKNSVSRNKTKPSAYLNVWGRRGFTLEQSYSNMRYLHSVQLPSHCGLGKQCCSPTLPLYQKKPPPKLVFLWPVIKT